MATDSVARIFSLAAIEAGQTDKKITVAEKVGGIEAGTVYPEGTALSTIISDLLTGGSPASKVTIYYGATDNKPTSVSGLTSAEVSISDLTSIDGYTVHINSGNTETKTGQYPIFAVPVAYTVIKWYIPGFEFNIPHTLVVNSGYNIYYLNDVSYDKDIGGIDYILKIQEV